MKIVQDIGSDMVLGPGYCGFITREADFVGDGIEWFSRWDGGLPFVHTFVVEEAGTYHTAGGIIEAHARLGVRRANIGEYIGQKNCQCFVRVPYGWGQQAGREIASAAADHIGDKYGYGLIVADALANSYLGHLVNAWTGNVPDRLVCALFTSRHHTICSQLVAESLQSQYFLGLRGCLKGPADTIMPAQLGNDDSVFQPECYQVG